MINIIIKSKKEFAEEFKKDEKEIDILLALIFESSIFQEFLWQEMRHAIDVVNDPEKNNFWIQQEYQKRMQEL